MKRTLIALAIVMSAIQTHAQAPSATAQNGGGEGAKQITQAEAKQQGLRASKMIGYDQSCQSGQGETALTQASKATVQIVHKSMISKTATGFKIQEAPSWYCKSHPLSRFGEPAPPLDGSALGQSLASEKAQNCSGFLIGDSKTIGTSAHCMGQLSSKQFCDEYRIVFGRACGAKEFSEDQVFKCQGDGVVKNTISDVEKLNLHTDEDAKDHAFFKLEKAVPEEIAKPLKFGDTTQQKTGDKVYAIGHPGGTQRTISPLTFRKRTMADQGRYCFGSYEGYIYKGNSGGPIVDGNGNLVGIASSSDDKKFGDARKRIPLVGVEGEGVCNTQVDNGPIEVVGVGACKEVVADAAVQQSESRDAGSISKSKAARAAQ